MMNNFFYYDNKLIIILLSIPTSNALNGLRTCIVFIVEVAPMVSTRVAPLEALKPSRGNGAPTLP